MPGLPGTPNPGASIASPGVAAQGVQSPLTPLAGRPHTPGGGGRPLTPVAGGNQMGLGGVGRGQGLLR